MWCPSASRNYPCNHYKKKAKKSAEKESLKKKGKVLGNDSSRN